MCEKYIHRFQVGTGTGTCGTCLRDYRKCEEQAAILRNQESQKATPLVPKSVNHEGLFVVKKTQ